jgi:hypothetical protein
MRSFYLSALLPFGDRVFFLLPAIVNFQVDSKIIDDILGLTLKFTGKSYGKISA